MYRDFSQEKDDKLLTKAIIDSYGEGYDVNKYFPIMLHQMISEADVSGFTSVISWQRHGRSFIIHDTQRLVKEILPLYFPRMSKIASFKRQLTLYWFRRITKGPDKGGYYHEYFLRGMAFLCYRILRSEQLPEPEPEPDFYSMSFLPHDITTGRNGAETATESSQNNNLSGSATLAHPPEYIQSLALSRSETQVNRHVAAFEEDQADLKLPFNANLNSQYQLGNTKRSREREQVSVSNGNSAVNDGCGVASLTTSSGGKTTPLNMYQMDGMTFEGYLKRRFQPANGQDSPNDVARQPLETPTVSQLPLMKLYQEGRRTIPNQPVKTPNTRKSGRLHPELSEDSSTRKRKMRKLSAKTDLPSSKETPSRDGSMLPQDLQFNFTNNLTQSNTDLDLLTDEVKTIINYLAIPGTKESDLLKPLNEDDSFDKL